MKVMVVPTPPSFAIAGFQAVTGTARETLDQRRGVLETFSQQLLSSARAIAVSSRRERGSGTPFGMTDVEPTIVLPALGAVILEEELIDRRAVEASGQALVFNNVHIPLVDSPVSGETTVSATEPWHLEKVDVRAARARGLTGSGVLLGILDTGIDVDHPEFAGKQVHFAEFDANGTLVSRRPRDAGNHGTHVSGLAAGRTCGIAPDAELAVAAVLTQPDFRGRLGGFLVQIARGLDWLLTEEFRGGAADPGCELVNASLGSSGYRDYLHKAVSDARRDLGTVMVAAIGNAGEQGVNNHGSPGNYDIVVGVGAVDRDDRPAVFSDWGNVPQHSGLAKPDLAAPGANVVSSVPGGGFAPMDGTSMASPIVAGACALLLQQNPELRTNAPGLVGSLLALTVPPSGPRTGRGRLSLTGI
jgi:subtilisin family serine protease